MILQLRDGTQMQTSRIHSTDTRPAEWNTGSKPESCPQFSCPECGSTELKLTVSLSGMVTYRFSADETNELISADEFTSEFPTLGDCECPHCGWAGLTLEASHIEHAPTSATSRNAFQR
jgi:predicted RNA-binding Zn-ribbon protein involved in translation (DUF1610 family)